MASERPLAFGLASGLASGLAALVATLPGLALALPVDPQLYPVRAPVEGGSCAPSPCTVQIEVPPELRVNGQRNDGTELALADPAGNLIPFAFSTGERITVDIDSVQGPSLERGQVVFEAPDRLVDGFRLNPGRSGDFAVTVQAMVRGNDGQLKAHGQPSLLWKVNERSRVHHWFPPTRQPIEVYLKWHRGIHWISASLDLVARTEGAGDPVTIDLPVVSSWVEEGSAGHHIVSLPHPIGPGTLRIQAQGTVFSRSVEVFSPEETGRDRQLLGSGNLERIQIGDAAVDLDEVRLESGTANDQLEIVIAAVDQDPLAVPKVSLEVQAEALWVLDPPAGPWTLYGGASPGTLQPSDLAIARPELARLTRANLRPGSVEENPQWMSLEARSGLTGPGPLLEGADAYRWGIAISGPEGLVRVPIDATIQQLSRSSLADIRLIDSAGNQIPFLLRRLAQRIPIEGVTIERVEEGAISRIRVKNPQPGQSIETAVLTTTSPVFSRRISMVRPTAGSPEVMRAGYWNRNEPDNHAPGRFAMQIREVVGDELQIEIDNGGDAPIDIGSVELQTVGWELLTHLPADGATLLVGRRSDYAPGYDLEMLRADLTRRNAETATLGTPVERQGAGISPTERAAVWGSLLLMVAGMGAMTIRVVRATPPAPGPDENNGQPKEAGETPKDGSTGEPAPAPPAGPIA